ncbi:Piso0_001311 [Millerozyma farinosa CBS 7064]|uniref:Mitochondrial thiamine pyrophosphate carrier 1 n=1 Tax=Pichia sorbitophila (strain ATCC MYA-4447 / BCRC 22081 / CBS 7064 / NBRC 10061 / NRRL Y-12695) TaxID=559304 RepID=G8YMU1_PICSO|nr:Piso0_001311 [Millerozyma farinosa CBS 7064]
MTSNLGNDFNTINENLAVADIGNSSESYNQEFQYPQENDDAGNTKAVRNSNQTVTLSTAGIRAIVYQLQALYLRTPVKLFRPSRFDYLAYVRELANKHDNLHSKPYKLRTHSSIAMLVNVIRKEGWKFIPDQVLPPLLANSATGLILYGTYLTSLDYFDEANVELKRSGVRKEHYYSPVDTWRAGFVAGAAQSLAAAPVDAIYTRSSAAEMLNGQHQNLWVYGVNKLREVGLTGVFSGFGFSLIKESLGFAFYFSTFEVVKTQGYNLTYRMLNAFNNMKLTIKEKLRFLGFKFPEAHFDESTRKLELKRSTKILKSSFILLAGASAAFALLAVQYPITKIQNVHLSRLEALDFYNSSRNMHYRPSLNLYYNSYVDTLNQVLKFKAKSKYTWFQMGYKGFARNALTSIPATSMGLLVFEIMRTKLSDSLEEEDILEAY